MVFKPGQSGNIKGPKPSEFRQQFLSIVKERGLVDKAIEVMEYHLSKKSMEAAKYLLDQAVCKAPQPIVGNDGGILNLNFITPEKGICQK